MATKRARRLRMPMSQRIKTWTAILVAITGFVVAANDSYLKIKPLQLVQRAAGRIGNLSGNRASPPTSFTLDVRGETFATNPHDAAIKSAVLTVAAKPENAFLVLQRSDENFIQAATVKDGWVLQFRTTGFDRPGRSPMLFECQKSVSVKVVTKALQLYGADNDAWNRLCAWAQTDI